MLNYKTYRNKIKGSWLGKNIGGTFGAPLEGKAAWNLTASMISICRI